MNKIIIAEVKPEEVDKKTYFVEFSQANEMLTILRSDYFEICSLNVPAGVTNAKLRFLMHFSRLISVKGKIVIFGNKQGVDKTKTILKNMGMHILSEGQESLEFCKKKVEEEKKVQKLAIGFKSQNQAIDEEELLKNQKINIEKKEEGASCADKPRACANCNCGRKQNEPLPSKEELVNSVNEGKPVSGCGKCFLGDSFRCATCPYQGMPAFKPGDKLKLVDESKVIVEESTTVVQSGKVKLQI